MIGISVVIPTFNHGHMIGRAVESVLAQSTSPIEVIIVDDGSTDTTRRGLARYGKALKYIYQENQGVSAARNTGIDASRGDWIAFLDADDSWHPNKLQEQEDLLGAVPDDVGCIYSRLVVVGESYELLSPSPPRSGAVGPYDLLRRNWIGTSSVVAHRVVLEQLRGFDSQLRAIEDWDLWLRMAISGVGFAYSSNPLVRHYLSAGSLYGETDQVERDTDKMFTKFFQLPNLSPDLRHLETATRAGFQVQMALQCVASGQRSRSLGFIVKAIRRWPLVLLRIETLGVVVRLSLGTRLYSALRGWRRSKRRLGSSFR